MTVLGILAIKPYVLAGIQVKPDKLIPTSSSFLFTQDPSSETLNTTAEIGTISGTTLISDTLINTGVMTLPINTTIFVLEGNSTIPCPTETAPLLLAENTTEGDPFTTQESVLPISVDINTSTLCSTLVNIGPFTSTRSSSVFKVEPMTLTTSSCKNTIEIDTLVSSNPSEDLTEADALLNTGSHEVSTSITLCTNEFDEFPTSYDCPHSQLPQPSEFEISSPCPNGNATISTMIALGTQIIAQSQDSETSTSFIDFEMDTPTFMLCTGSYTTLETSYEEPPCSTSNGNSWITNFDAPTLTETIIFTTLWTSFTDTSATPCSESTLFWEVNTVTVWVHTINTIENNEAATVTSTTISKINSWENVDTGLSELNPWTEVDSWVTITTHVIVDPSEAEWTSELTSENTSHSSVHFSLDDGNDSITFITVWETISSCSTTSA